MHAAHHYPESYASTKTSAIHSAMDTACGTVKCSSYRSVHLQSESSGNLYCLRVHISNSLLKNCLSLAGMRKRWDTMRVSLYVGLLSPSEPVNHSVQASLFYVTQALTVLQWSTLSDRVGRKPVLLAGLFGMSVSMVSFGMSKSYGGLVIR